MPNLDSGDELQIRNLLSAYAHALDGRRVDEFAELFAEDAVLTAAGKAFRGTVELRNFVQALMDRPAGMHVTVNSVLEADGEQVRVTSNFMLLSHNNGTWSVGMAGTYRDRFARRAGQWRFIYREIGFKP
jgi:uncharacterized protein (TIGR02246 family)